MRKYFIFIFAFVEVLVAYCSGLFYQIINHTNLIQIGIDWAGNPQYDTTAYNYNVKYCIQCCLTAKYGVPTIIIFAVILLLLFLFWPLSRKTKKGEVSEKELRNRVIVKEEHINGDN